jgi:diguanylate cyclase (GGDEF)-like protein
MNMTGIGSRSKARGARVGLVLALLALAMAWLALGGAARLPWQRALYVPLHTAAEVFAVVVAAMIFSIGWHSFDGKAPGPVALLAPAFLAAGLLDIGHLMTVPGMPGLAGPGRASTSIAFWLFARALVAGALLVAAIAPPGCRARPAARRASVLIALALAALGFWLALRRPDLLPATFVEGYGLTPFKVWAEYTLMAVFALAALVTLRRALAQGAASDWYMVGAAATLALGGVGFALYRAPDDLLSLCAHLYKVAAYLCLYRAIFVAAVHEPYQRLRRSESSLAASETKFRELMEAAPDAILLADEAGGIAMMNARAETLFNLPRTRAAGIPLAWLVPGEGDEVNCVRVQGETFPAEVRRGLLDGGAGAQGIVIVRDISERRRLEKELLEQLSHDALTGLPNRRRILETLAESIAAQREAGRMLAVLVLDIDQFKKINNGFGFAEGDDVLRECVRRLAAALAPGDTLARPGGNEFIIVQKGVAERAQAAELALALLARVREPFMLRGQQVVLSASVGIAVMPDDDIGAQGLVHKAQVAMGAARQHGAGQFRFHTAEMELKIRERVSLETYLRNAVDCDELTLQYQPRVSVANGRMVGVEALVRWRHPVLGLVPPARFIHVAEETGLIEEIDMWVLREACTRVARWQAAGLGPLRVSVNLSARQFQQVGLAGRVRSVLAETGLAPACLELEITEGTVMHDLQAAQAVLQSLKQIGVVLSIDDFGTGYSSLSYLKRFPIDVLKIDRSFIMDVIDDPNDAAITRAIIAVAHGLELEAVAEGVETAEQVAFLRANGCDEIQGYYFSPPVWPDQLEGMLGDVKENFVSAPALQ